MRPTCHHQPSTVITSRPGLFVSTADFLPQLGGVKNFDSPQMRHYSADEPRQTAGSLRSSAPRSLRQGRFRQAAGRVEAGAGGGPASLEGGKRDGSRPPLPWNSPRPAQHRGLASPPNEFRGPGLSLPGEELGRPWLFWDS